MFRVKVRVRVRVRVEVKVRSGLGFERLRLTTFAVYPGLGLVKVFFWSGLHEGSHWSCIAAAPQPPLCSHLVRLGVIELGPGQG